MATIIKGGVLLAALRVFGTMPVVAPVAGLVASYLGLYFYLRVIQYMFMAEHEPTAARGAPRRLAVIASVLCLVPGMLLMFFPGWLIDRL
jgi:NADH-quinone oxidoreductase subunit N